MLQLAVRVLQPCAHRVDAAVNLGDTVGRGAIVFDRTRAHEKDDERSGRKAGKQAGDDEHWFQASGASTRDSLGWANERRTVGRLYLLAQGGTPAGNGLTACALALTSRAMAVRDILIIPDKRLRLKSEPVKAIDKPLRALVDDMFETMYAAPGIGLAAIQIGVPKRVVTMDLAKKDEPKQPQVFINPEVIWSSEEKRLMRKAACRSRNITKRSRGRRR